MSWEEEHRKRVSKFPETVREAHTQSAIHRTEIESSDICGCFYCRTTFKPNEIKEWVDENKDGHGQTALCPHCGIDSVIGSKSGFRLDVDFLKEMNRYWF